VKLRRQRKHNFFCLEHLKVLDVEKVFTLYFCFFFTYSLTKFFEKKKKGRGLLIDFLPFIPQKKGKK